MHLGGSRLNPEQVGEIASNNGQIFNQPAGYDGAGRYVVGLHHLRVGCHRNYRLFGAADVQFEVLAQRAFYIESYGLRL